MFLKRITLSGFKSFADRVDFDFGPGVTCIVGPNGCGKSNVLDSLKWVLGEQSARSLRGRQMADMIFNGSSTRRASSLAQVDLVFGNADRTLPLDQDEVTVTRRLYRSGESEYLLNNHQTRLKDVRELFMDTGVGVDAYSMIEQGRVDSLLQSSPLERRAIFEEAAGISKYKARKKNAQRKLERTQQNLLRVADIIEELERRLRSVKLQAGKARSFKQYEARLNELRSTYVTAEYHRLSGNAAGLHADITALEDRATALKADIGRQESAESSITVELDRIAEQIADADNQLVQARAASVSQEERIEAAKGRIREQRALSERLAERMELDTVRLEDLEKQLVEATDAAASMERQSQELRGQVDNLIEDDRVKARDLTEAQAVLEDEKAGIIDLLRKSAQVHNEIVRLSGRREDLVGQKGRLAARDAQIAVELEHACEQRAALTGRMAELEAALGEQNEALDAKKNEASRVEGVRRRLLAELASLKESRSAIASRRQLLEDLQRNLEGVGSGVRQFLDMILPDAESPAQKPQTAPAAPGELARFVHEVEPTLARDGEDVESPWTCDAAEAVGSAVRTCGVGGDYRTRNGLIGLVANLVDCETEHARIVEAVLGERDQHLLATSSAAFLELASKIEVLEGRVTVLCLDRLPPVLNERDFSGHSGFVARAVDLVRVSPDYEYLASHLFAKTVVVEQLQHALDMAGGDVTGHRFVTLDGELVEPDGRITLGPATAGAGLISRRSELRELDGEMARCGHRLDILADQLNRTEAEAGYLDGVQEELRAAIYQTKQAQVEANADLQKVGETIERLAQEKPLIMREVTLLEHEIEEVLVGNAENGRKLEALEKENEKREARVAALRERIDSIVAARQEVQASLTEVKVAAGQLAEKRAASVEKMASMRRSIEELQNAVSTAQRDLAECRARIDKAEATIAAGRQEIATLAETIRRLDTDAGRLRQQREALRVQLQGVAQDVKAKRGDLEAAESELHQRQMSLAETNVRRDELVARVREELAIDLVERYRQYEHQEQDWSQVEQEIADLKQKMARLGNVNLDAIDELAELEARHEFLTGQRDDLTTSHHQLEQLITRLDAESRERFQTAFVQIRDHFRALFRKLFGGGRADIVLEDPENQLDCGIEIVAQPPGKDLQIISLMSGGEKSLTAIALLMSIFKCRPAPFAILDEVDAALDEANNDRYNRIVQEFVSESQFILITHSKRTMSIGEQLYGITMQEPGVSTRVSVQLADAQVA